MDSVPLMSVAYFAIFHTSAPFFNQIILYWGPVSVGYSRKISSCSKRKDKSAPFSSGYFSSCLTGWTYLEHTGRCYKFEPKATSWTDAIQSCQSVTSNPSVSLASIPDKTTNDFLATLTNEPSWIGGYRIPEGWAWSDGTDWNFSNWHTETGEPNNYNGLNENYVMTNFIGKNGFWADYPDSKYNKS